MSRSGFQNASFTRKLNWGTMGVKKILYNFQMKCVKSKIVKKFASIKNKKNNLAQYGRPGSDGSSGLDENNATNAYDESNELDELDGLSVSNELDGLNEPYLSNGGLDGGNVHSDNGSDYNGSDNNGSDDNGSDSNGSDYNGSDDNGSDDNGPFENKVFQIEKVKSIFNLSRIDERLNFSRTLNKITKKVLKLIKLDDCFEDEVVLYGFRSKVTLVENKPCILGSTCRGTPVDGSNPEPDSTSDPGPGSEPGPNRIDRQSGEDFSSDGPPDCRVIRSNQCPAT